MPEQCRWILIYGIGPVLGPTLLFLLCAWGVWLTEKWSVKWHKLWDPLAWLYGGAYVGLDIGLTRVVEHHVTDRYGVLALVLSAAGAIEGRQRTVTSSHDRLRRRPPD
jgi:hypothetical protein